jgi:hypothetical protein
MITKHHIFVTRFYISLAIDIKNTRTIKILNPIPQPNP